MSRLLAVATLIGMFCFYAFVTMSALYALGKINFCPSDVDMGSAFGVYVVGLVSLMLTKTDNEFVDE